MSIYPWSILFSSEASVLARALALLAVVSAVLFMFWVYCHQNGISLMRVMNETANKMRKSAIRMNSKSGFPDTVSALLNKADSIPFVTHPATTSDTTPLINKNNPLITAPICRDCTKQESQGQSQITSKDRRQSEPGNR